MIIAHEPPTSLATSGLLSQLRARPAGLANGRMGTWPRGNTPDPPPSHVTAAAQIWAEATGHCDGDSSVASLAVSRKVIQSMRRCLAPEQRVIDAPGAVGLLEGSNDGVESIDAWLVPVYRCLLTDFVEVIHVRAYQR